MTSLVAAEQSQKLFAEVGMGVPWIRGSKERSRSSQNSRPQDERSERRGKNLWSPWTITSFWNLSDCMSNCFVRTNVAAQFDYKNVSCALRRKPGSKDK